MTEATINAPTGDQTDLTALREEITSLGFRLNQLQEDIRYIKDIFLAKQSKKERRRQKKEQARLAIEREAKARKNREMYEDIIWKLIRRPWSLMPAPQSKLSPKELELISLLARNKTHTEVAEHMALKENSIRPRICAACKKVGLRNEQELIAYYCDFRKQCHVHRRRRCLILLTWLLNPPPGFIRRRNLDPNWHQKMGRSRKFRYAGPYVPTSVFDRFRHYEHNVLRLKARGLSYAEIATRLNLKEAVLRGYFSQIRADIKGTCGATITDTLLIDRYKKYLKLMRRRELDKPSR